MASLPFDAKEELADMAEQVFLPQIPADRFPYLHEAAAKLVAAGYDPAAEFEVGLGLILDVLEGLRRGRSAPHALARNIATTNAPKPPNS